MRGLLWAALWGLLFPCGAFALECPPLPLPLVRELEAPVQPPQGIPGDPLGGVTPHHDLAAGMILPASQVQAVTSLRFAHAAVGKDGAALLRLYVRDNLSAEEIGRRRGEGRDQTMGRIRATLERLAEHWGMV